jgi:hypothetical protein
VSRDLAQPADVRASGGDLGESGCLDEAECLVEHVLFSRMPKPSWTGMPTPSALVKLSDQEPSTGLKHSVHLLDRSRLIILSHMVQREGAPNGVEGGIRKREILCEGDLEGGCCSPFACLAAGPVDHFNCCINAVHRAAGCYPLGKDAGKPARATADIEDPITGPKLKIVSQHLAQTVSTSTEQAVPQVVEACPVDEPVAAVVIGMAGGVDHRHESVRRSPCRLASRVRRIDQDPSFLRIDADILRP